MKHKKLILVSFLVLVACNKENVKKENVIQSAGGAGGAGGSAGGAGGGPVAGAGSYLCANTQIHCRGACVDSEIGCTPTLISFTESNTYSAAGSTTVSGINLADLNDDKKLDMITSQYQAPGQHEQGDPWIEGFRIWIGNGDGSFQTPTDIVTQHNRGNFLNDFDGDGRVDTMIIGDSNIASFWGNGDGTFSDGIPIITPSIESTDYVDFNQDGLQDIIYMASGSIWLIKNNGKRQFEPPQKLINIQDWNTPYDIQSADMDGDGSIDIVFSFSENSPLFLKNDKKGVLNPPAKIFNGGPLFQLGKFHENKPIEIVHPKPIKISSLDGVIWTDSSSYISDPVLRLNTIVLKKDEHIDLVSMTANRVWISRGHGNGTLSPPEMVPVENINMVGTSHTNDTDLNGDGIGDLVVLTSMGAIKTLLAKIPNLNAEGWELPFTLLR